MEIEWVEVKPGEVFIGSDNRSILFGSIGPRHENKIEYSFEISSMPIEKDIVKKLLSSGECTLASEAEWELARKQEKLFGNDGIEELGDKIRNSYWNKYCDGRVFIDFSWDIKIGRKWENGVPSTIYLDKCYEENRYFRIVRKIKNYEHGKNNFRLPKSPNKVKLAIEEFLISLLFGIIPSFLWAYFNATEGYITEGWLNLIFGGFFIGFFTVIFWRPRTKTFLIGQDFKK